MKDIQFSLKMFELHIMKNISNNNNNKKFRTRKQEGYSTFQCDFKFNGSMSFPVE